MKLSHTMLNFLGYMAEADGWCDEDAPVSFCTPFGARAAIKNGLIVEGTLDLPGRADPMGNALGLGLPASYPGYRLTPLGNELATIGRRLREEAPHPSMDGAKAIVAEAQAILDARLSGRRP